MRLALLGVGRLGAAHAATLAEQPDVTELRIFDVDVTRASELAERLRARAVESVDAALESIDAAVIVTPTPTHAALIHRCLDAGIPTFCEKPIALEIGETREVVEHVTRVGGVLQIGFQRRFDVGYREARRLVREGAVGTVYSFYMTSRDALPPPDSYIETSGGQFTDQMIHDFDITRWLFGVEVEEVFATGSTRGFDQYRGFEDVATSGVVLRLLNGTLGLISAARHNPAGYDVRVEIYGSKDSIAVGLDQRAPIRSVEMTAPALSGPAYPNFFERFGDAYRAELAHFLRLARREVENPCSAVEALEALRIALASDRSLRERRPVRLAELP